MASRLKTQLRVIDTSAWIEMLISSAFGKRLEREFPDKPFCLVPTIVQLELAKWVSREVGEDQADSVIAYTAKCCVVPLDTRLALLAAEMHKMFKLATADAIVYATAINANAELVTCDAHFKGLPGVLFLRKHPPKARWSLRDQQWYSQLGKQTPCSARG